MSAGLPESAGGPEEVPLPPFGTVIGAGGRGAYQESV